MNESERKQLVKQFVSDWTGKGYEKGDSQKFWIRLLSDVLGIENATEYIRFEEKVVIDHTSFIDGFIDETKVLIEQKSIDKNLRKGIKQSDGSLLTPFQQAKRYSAELPYDDRPRWIITCNFQEFLIYDMNKPQSEPVSILLKDLDKEFYRLEFIKSKENDNLKREMEVSIKAGELVGKIYTALLKEYKNPSDEKTLESLNMFCVRIVFCMYAEDAGIFGGRNKFGNYLKLFTPKQARKAIIALFKILDQKPEDRDPYEDVELMSFPYVNGGLFENENIEIPNFTDEIYHLITQDASEDFDWSEISPTIFGAVFESTLNPETRRSGGMHYTSIENIHKVIDPLFLNDLKSEFEEIQLIKVEKTRRQKLEQFQLKLADLKFLDPACGSGNFLTETYISIRKLENAILKLLHQGQLIMDIGDLIKVSISQFYGIEVNDFAVTVGRTALWIAESQMLRNTREIIHVDLDFLPLRSYAHIIHANALTTDWEEVVPKTELDYIMGNPPFIGKQLQTSKQKMDLLKCFPEKAKKINNLDYVSGWYMKASQYIHNTNIETAFVSTNSITQGEQVPILWKQLSQYNTKINFAYRTFKWASEASEKAAVHCVIIGYANFSRSEKILFSDIQQSKAKNISPYLVDSQDIIIESRRTPLYNISKMDFGSMPNDGGFLSKYTYDDMTDIINKYPDSKKFFREFLGSEEFINNKKRYCLWLENISPNEYSGITPIMKAISNVKEIRLNSSREATRNLADTPYLFGEIRQPKTNYLLIPRVSSENRKYIPLGFIDKSIVAGDRNMMIPDATLYEFGILTSNVHMAWVKTVCGRLKSDYNYSATIVYNNFPWCTPSDAQKQKIEQTAQAILDARALYPDSSLADLYNELTMPVELRKAHQQNDKAVMAAYGFTTKTVKSESECVAELMKLYQAKVDELEG